MVKSISDLVTFWSNLSAFGLVAGGAAPQFNMCLSKPGLTMWVSGYRSAELLSVDHPIA
jgi:hypothetical protein